MSSNIKQQPYVTPDLKMKHLMVRKVVLTSITNSDYTTVSVDEDNIGWETYSNQ